MITIPISKPRIWGSELKHIARSIETTQISGTAPPVREFEERFADFLGRKHAVTAANGTLAIQLALMACDFAKNSEVLVPSYCMMSPVFAALAAGLKVIPITIDESWNIDPASVEEKITNKTVAILAVHNYGQCSDMPALQAIADKHGLLLIEDAAEAFGATLADQAAGTFGLASCFSLYANKAITTGEGGVIVSDDDTYADRMRYLRNLSFGPSSDRRYEHSTVGVNYRLSALQASFGLGQLEFANDAIASKREVGLRYVEAFSNIDGFELQIEQENSIHAYWAIAGTLAPSLRPRRRDIQTYMHEHGIETRRFFCPVHRHANISSNIGGEGQSYQYADEIYDAGICLPSFIGMSGEDVETVCSVMADAMEKFSN